MAVEYSAVEAAYGKRQAIEDQRAQIQALLTATPINQGEKRIQLEEQLKILDKNYDLADRELNRVSDDFNRQNPPEKQATELTEEQKLRVAELKKEIAEKDENERKTGLRETNAARANREERIRGNPAAQQNADTATVNAINNAQHQQRQEQRLTVSEQRQALTDHGNLVSGVYDQESANARERYQGQGRMIESSRGAATTLVTDATTRRGQDIDLQQSRMTFISSMLTTIMPRIADLMMKTPKGSKVAANFAMTMLAMANEAYQNAGLHIDHPAADPNSVENKTLRNIARISENAKAPEMASAAEVGWNTAKVTAGLGFPLKGWQSKTGTEAFLLPDMPPGTNGEGVNLTAQAVKSEQGVAIEQKWKKTVEGVNPNTAEGRAAIEAAKAGYNRDIENLVKSNQLQARQATPAADDAAKLKQDVRAEILSSDPDVRLKNMTDIVAAQKAKDEGRVLTPAQIALLSNVDPEDISLIKQYITPEIEQIIASKQTGTKLTPEQVSHVKQATDLAQNAVSQRSPLVPRTVTPDLRGPAPTPEPTIETDPVKVKQAGRVLLENTETGRLMNLDPEEAKRFLEPVAPGVPIQWRVKDAPDTRQSLVFDPSAIRSESQPLSQEERQIGQDIFTTFHGADTQDEYGTPSWMRQTDIPDLSAQYERMPDRQTTENVYQPLPEQEIPEFESVYKPMNSYDEDEEERKRREARSIPLFDPAGWRF